MNEEEKSLLTKVLQTPADSLRKWGMDSAGIENEIKKKKLTDNYQFFKELKEKVKPIVNILMWIFAITFSLLIFGWLMYLYGCPFIKPEAGERIEATLISIASWFVGILSHYGLNKWKKS